MKQLPKLNLQSLSAASARDTGALQALLEQAPHYFRSVTGAPAGPNAAIELLGAAALPAGKSREDQLVLGALVEGTLVACAALLRAYPAPPITFIGLLLVGEPWERQGYGTRLFRTLTEELDSWSTCDRLRLAVLSTNERALQFWARQGFNATGEREPFTCGDIHAEALLHERAIRP